jgi:hypothetical protein
MNTKKIKSKKKSNKKVIKKVIKKPIKKSNKKSNKKNIKGGSPNPFVYNRTPNIMRMNNYLCLKENSIKDLSNIVYELFGRRIVESDTKDDIYRTKSLGLNKLYRDTDAYKNKKMEQYVINNFNPKKSLRPIDA